MFPVLLTAAGTMPGRVKDAGMLLLLAGVFLAGVGGGDSAVLDEKIAGGAGDGALRMWSVSGSALHGGYLGEEVEIFIQARDDEGAEIAAPEGVERGMVIVIEPQPVGERLQRMGEGLFHLSLTWRQVPETQKLVICEDAQRGQKLTSPMTAGGRDRDPNSESECRRH